MVYPVRIRWIEKIVAGDNVCEIRSKPNSRTGRIALALKGGPLVATCTVGPSVALSKEDFRKNFGKHKCDAGASVL